MAIVFLVPLGAFAVLQARLDLLVHRHTREAVEVFVVAESGLEHAIADLALDPSFDRLLAGPDKIIGTADDQHFPFHHQPPSLFPQPPLRYDVRVESCGDECVEIVSRGRSAGQISRKVDASVVRSLTPYLPGTVFSAAPAVTLEMDDAFTISGIDDDQSDTVLPALAVASEEAAQALTVQLGNDPGTPLLPPGIAVEIFSPLDAMAAAAAQIPGARMLTGSVAGSLGEGVLISPTPLHVADASGSGILIVDGMLRISGRFTFSGLIVTLGDVRFDPGSSVNIDGVLFQAASGTHLQFHGAGQIRYDRRIIEQIDAQFPDFLPRQTIVTGWHEQSWSRTTSSRSPVASVIAGCARVQAFSVYGSVTW